MTSTQKLTPTTRGAAPKAAAEAEPIDQAAAAATVLAAIGRVLTTQSAAIDAAADCYVQTFDAGGVLQVFGTGHSRGLAMEVAGRAGGLVPANQLSIKDVVMYGDASPESILSPEAERDPAIAHAVLKCATIEDADTFVIASNSGGNGATVEMALEAKRRGHRVIAITSMRHTRRITSRHPSGQRLFEIADIVIDNGAVFGDAELPIPGLGGIVPTSAITANLIAEMITAQACGIMLERGDVPPILISANVPGGDEHNQAMRGRYGPRLRVGEP